ncbi:MULTISPECIES: Eco57I restriction-modification methylase domain-containing protein [unclassified Campylobacter]|uniref:Eco57I restriction-modification methylase domain-containing protein n=1 Tax=unclassified Campylobacter TaxID=2593542 RepID=UPI0022E9B1D8|nr:MULTISPECIES: Eco57I restriction-modification methylase domain-containing protein [unclassified Campylobacter]MDA3061612.1 Eco57I restriction-modification methylase domain-containing protein [Campylobacter sp. JMF_14 EL1]MDA3073282.1 Eco57I restriction-modification methylase domain-containing protein [Campylobacter sp. JMF_10 EL2]
MALFKEKIIKEQKQDEKTLNERYENLLKFQAKIDAIKGYKEEEYQTDFLHDIFEACLGYTLKTTNPQNFNLARESKNETDAKKADGAILGANSEVIGVIELKDQKTHDLDKIENQAFNYHNSNSKSRYIIISNFDEIRLYIDKKTAYEKFSLFTMTRDEFELFHQIFCFENINSFKTIDLRDKSENSDREISKRLYADFSEFRLKLFENAVQENPQISPKEILSLVQKLCDRIIFVLFAEDYGLLRSNFVADIHEQWQNQKFTDFSLYEIWQIYFDAIDKGNDKLGVLAYNGGLFATDETLNSLRLSDEILQSYIAKLSSYDFASDIGVNILGHIFEQSLSDLEELNSQIVGDKFDKKDSKRKKDGIFYTPEYIVKFIISQTLGQICENEKSRLNLHEISLPKNPKRLSKAETQTLENIRAYKEFLLGLKIIDPACGSGAFLNGALDFLINEHKNLDKFRKIYENEALPLYDIEPQILENNLFGVDINADAVQIAKLSLWLRTAQKGRKLTDLSNNIKCANSLLDFPFDFKFDCVIGNPPYIRVQGLKAHHEQESKIYEQKFTSATGNYDIYVLFMEQGFKWLNKNGKLGFILPHKFLISDFGNGIRKFLSQNKALEKLYHFGSHSVFSDASTYTCICILSHDNQKLKFTHLNPNELTNSLNLNEISYQNLSSDKWNLTDNKTANILEKINSQPLKVSDVFAKIFAGIQTSGDNVYLVQITKNGLYSKALDKIVQIENGLLKPILKGEDIKRYANLQNRYFVIFPYLLENGKATPMSEDYIKSNFPNGYEYLKANEAFLRGREKGKMDKDGWFLYIYPKSLNLIDSKKLVVPDITFGIQIAFDNVGYGINGSSYGIVINDEFGEFIKFYLAILNSKLLWFYLKNIGTELRGGYFRFKTNYIKPFGLPKLANLDEEKPFVQKVDLLLELNKNLQTTKTKFLRELNLEKIPQKLAEFENLEFDEFIKEYAKAKKEKFADKLAEVKFKNYYQGFFSEYKSQTLSLKSQILRSENELNSLVYALYNLTADEIALIENS